MADATETATEVRTETETPADDADLDVFEDEVATALRTEFSIEDEDAVAWTLGKIGSMGDEIARLDQTYKARRAELVKKRDGFTEFVTPLLARYYDAHPPKGKGKTLKFLNGELARRFIPGGVRIEDEATLIESLRAMDRPDLIRVTYPEPIESVDREGVKALADEIIAAHMDLLSQQAGATGEIPTLITTLPAGLRNAPDEDRFYVKPATTKGGK